MEYSICLDKFGIDRQGLEFGLHIFADQNRIIFWDEVPFILVVSCWLADNYNVFTVLFCWSRSL